MNASYYATTIREQEAEDGSTFTLVRYWNVYTQRWEECEADAVSDIVLATFPESERLAVEHARSK